MRIEALIACITFVILLVVLAYMGHILWLGISWLFRTLFMGHKCPNCGHHLVGNESCVICSRERLELQQRPSVSDDLKAAERLRQYAGFHGWLDEAQNEYLRECLVRLRYRVSGMAAPPVQDAAAAAALPTTSENPSHHPEAVVDAQVIVSPTITHALDQDYEPAVTATPAIAPAPDYATVAPGPLRAQVLRSFMERSNIRWVELISASLVVVCSVGLVISLWSTLSRTSRFFPSLVFMVATLAVHGAGQYTLGRWKLRTTSRGILHIGLMLIPLSVLVGILLAHRHGDQAAIEFSITNCLAVGIGLVAYSALAITASRALFNRYYAPVAAGNILSSATLLPIDLTNTASSYPAWSVSLLIPIVIVSMIVSLLLTRQAAWRHRWTNAYARRHIGMAVQVLFATLTACTFWFLKFKPTLSTSAAAELVNGLNTSSFTTNECWWLSVGLLGVAWSAWGWSVSLARGSLAASAAGHRIESGVIAPTVDRDASWLVVVGWVMAMIATSALAIGLWQANTSRITLDLLLAVAGAWWLLHGLLNRLSLPLGMGSLALIVATALACESNHIGWSEPLLAVDWLGQERLTWLSVLGAASTTFAAVCLAFARIKVADTQPSMVTLANSERVDRFIFKHVLGAGCAVLLVSACLTVIAACVPLGATPFGGQWAAWYLAFYGLTLTAMGIAIERDEQILPKHAMTQWIAAGLLPIGLTVSVLATLRFMQASELMPEWIAALRPARAWSVGLITLATTWAVLAVALKQFGWRTSSVQGNASAAPTFSFGSINWLNSFAIAISVCSLVGVVRLSDHLALVAQLYWQLPILSAAIWWTWRTGHARELMVLTSCVWAMATLTTMGQARQWWQELPLAVSVASHIALACLICAATSIIDRYWAKRMEDSQEFGWMFRPTYWATALVLLSSMMVLLITLGWPAIENLGDCLGLSFESEIMATGSPLALVQPTVAQALGVLGTIILWTFATWFSSRLPQLTWMRLALGISPVLVALTITASVPTASALSACLAVLSLSLIASELLTLLNKRWSETSEAGWQLMSSRQADSRPVVHLLCIGRAVAMSCLLGLTGLAIFLGWDGRLSAHLLPGVEIVSASANGDRWARLWAILGWMWPALMFLGVRCAFVIARDCGPGRTALVGTALAGMVACAASLLGTAAIVPFLYGSIAWLQWFVISIATVAGINAATTWFRNLAGLRVMDRGQSSTLTLMNKAAGGGRWKRAVTASNQLLGSGLACMLILCTIAAVSNILVPIRAFESIGALAGWPTLLAYGLLALVTACLWRNNEVGGRYAGLASYAALIALLLGMLAPIAAVFYADWLEAVPGRYAAGARQFEPYRAQVVAWLCALAFGLGVRLSASQKRWSARGEAMWIGLAVIVGVLALVGSAMDRETIWPVTELSTLALLTVLSGCFAGQSWRGHIAAVIASAACLTFSSPPSLNGLVELTWQILIGPLIVAAISLAWHVFTQDASASNAEPTRSPDALANWGSNFKTVDQTVSLHVPVFISLLTCASIFLWDMNATEFHWPIVASVGGGAWLLAIGRIWDARRGGRGSAIYCAFISAALTIAVLICHFNELPLATRGLIWMAGGLGALAAIAGCLREWLRESSRWIPALQLGKLAVEQADFERARRWMVPWHCSVGLLLLLPCGMLALGLDERVLRLANAALPLLSGLSILPIAIDASQRISRTIGLWLISFPVILFLSADLPSLNWDATTVETWYYGQRTMIALVLLGWTHWSLTHWLVGRLDWPKQLASSSWVCFLAAAAVGGGMLFGDTIGWWPRFAQSAELTVQITWLLAWVGLIARAIQFALRPIGLDCAASLRMRQWAVVAAEIGLALLAAATFLCFPHLFSGLLADWWPLIVYGIALLSAGIGQWAAASKHEVIADPVRRSSLLLPLVPLLGVWLPFSRQLNIDWSDWQSYSLILFSGAALYAMHGWLKPSVKLHSIAGLLVLLSFWTLLHSRPSLRFLEHPQFWVVPPAIATLIFVEANRARLTGSVVTAARYIAILVAYISSTAEIILKAFEGQMWQPLLLLLLAVIGVLAGIALRIRPFLFCGSAFVVVALLGMVWHAQQAIDQVWPWWAFGILTGVSLIAMLGYFEKNRPRVLAYVDRLKTWQ